VVFVFRKTPFRSKSKNTEPSGLSDAFQTAAVAVMGAGWFAWFRILDEMMTFESRYHAISRRLSTDVVTSLRLIWAIPSARDSVRGNAAFVEYSNRSHCRTTVNPEIDTRKRRSERAK
jgi:hypothetical protein